MMGIMFYMRPDQDFMDALRFGLDYFKNKYGNDPLECVVHPSMLTDYKMPDSMVIKAEPYILYRNFWLIKETEDETI